MKKFEAGKQYTHGWATNSDLKTTLLIEKRTEKSFWVEGKRRKIYIDKNGEYIMPYGFFSMASSLSSEDIVLEEIEKIEIKESITLEPIKTSDTAKRIKGVEMEEEIFIENLKNWLKL